MRNKTKELFTDATVSELARVYYHGDVVNIDGWDVTRNGDHLECSCAKFTTDEHCSHIRRAQKFFKAIDQMAWIDEGEQLSESEWCDHMRDFDSSKVEHMYNLPAYRPAA